MSIRNALLATGLAAAVIAGPVRAEDTRPLSAAQIALFETDHLRAIAEPERLQYRFAHATEAPGDAFVDQVNLDVRPRDDGAKDVWVEFLTGARRKPFPPLAGFHGNPLLMYFLERDVEAMHEQTGGTATYFRNRIRRAFVDEAELRPVEIERDGKKVAATEITLAPFRGDTHLAVFPGLGEKQYRFVLSDAVPGGLYEIAAEVPGAQGRPPRLKDTMTFAAATSCTRSEGPCAAPTP
jgi:hypothetical protein